MAVPYVKQTWTDGSGGATPLSAARLGVIEQGVFDVSLAPAVRVYNSVSLNINTATDTALTFDGERFDQAGGVASTMHDNVTPSRLTCRYAGVYQITGSVMFQASATGFRMVRIRLNGATFISHGLVVSNSGTIETGMTTAALWSLAVNDYVELVVQHTTGAGLNILAAPATSPEFMMARVA